MKDFIELAAESARELEAAYSDKPKLELIAWLQIALQRESMVATAYDNTYVEGQLDGWQEQYNLDQMVIDVVRRALTGVWAQENAHQGYFRAMMKCIDLQTHWLIESTTSWWR